MQSFLLRVQPLNSPAGRVLIDELDAELTRMYADLLPAEGFRGSPTPDPELQPDSNADLTHRDPADGTAVLTDMHSATKHENVTFIVAYPSTPEEPSPEEAAAAAGCVAVVRQPAPFVGFESNEKVGEIRRMYIRPSSRGSGCSRALMEAVERQARDVLDLHVLALATGFRQQAAIKVYERNGWTRRGLFGKASELDEETQKVLVCLEKRLR